MYNAEQSTPDLVQSPTQRSFSTFILYTYMDESAIAVSQGQVSLQEH